MERSEVSEDTKDTAEYPSPTPAKSWPETASSRTRVDIGALTHRGTVRPNNEDCFLVTRFERNMHTLLTNLPDGFVPYEFSEVGYGYLVADGMGGAAAGEIASREAISKLVDLVLDTPDWHMRLDNVGTNEVLARLDERFGKLRESLIALAEANPGLTGMGTTLTVAASLGLSLVVAHIGDSRAYLFHNGKLQQLTRDQTLAQDLAEIGVIRPEHVAKHHSRHILTGVISTQGEEAQAELLKVGMENGDQILLCTDGLTEMVSDERIAEALQKSVTAADACCVLIDLALEAGGNDNVTVVVGRYLTMDSVA